VTVDCARHNLKRPNGVGDVQLGEKYLNTDYIFLKSLPISDLVFLIVSYDIVCQWHKNLREHMKIFPQEQILFNNVKYI